MIALMADPVPRRSKVGASALHAMLDAIQTQPPADQAQRLSAISAALAEKAKTSPVAAGAVEGIALRLIDWPATDGLDVMDITRQCSEALQATAARR
jgi:hypothetical protein